jgi:hypothetical protein
MQAETVHLFPERIPVPCYVLDPDNADAPPRRFIGAAIGWSTPGHVLVSARRDGTGPVLAFPARWGFVPVDGVLVYIPDAVWRPLSALVAMCALAEAQRHLARLVSALRDTIPGPPPAV